MSGTGGPADAALASELEHLERTLHTLQVRADRTRLSERLDEAFEAGVRSFCDAKGSDPSAEKAVAPPAGLGARVDRYRCCLPALAGFST